MRPGGAFKVRADDRASQGKKRACYWQDDCQIVVRLLSPSRNPPWAAARALKESVGATLKLLQRLWRRRQRRVGTFHPYSLAEGEARRNGGTTGRSHRDPETTKPPR
jgi:hypothetical protein